MSHISMILTALMTMAMAVWIAPSAFALSRGHVLRNIALWLAIFLALALFYKNFGPGSPHPVFNMPESMSDMRGNAPAENSTPPDTSDKDNKDDTGAQGFTPPKD